MDVSVGRKTKRRAGLIQGFPRQAVRRWLTAHGATALCVLMLTLLAANLLSVLPRKTLTADEYAHIAAGFAYLHGDFRPNSEHPPLVKILAALPLIPMGLKGPFVIPASTPMKLSEDNTKYFWEANQNHLKAITFWARVPMIALTVILGALIFAFARSLFGPRAALLAVALFCLDPTILAHGRVVQTDIAAALGFLAMVAALVYYIRQPSTRRAVLLGLVVGTALCLKYSLLLLTPALAAALVVNSALAWRRGCRTGRLAVHLLVIAVLALLTINACYAFHRQPFDQQDQAWILSEAGDRGTTILSAMDALSYVIPHRFLFGVFYVWRHDAEGHAASLLGDYSTTGWWYYFPVAYALKTPPPLVLLAVAACAWATWRAFAPGERRFLWLLVPLALYAIIACTSRINIGIRHLLPAYPFLFILGGVALDRVFRPPRRPALRPLGPALATGLLAWLIVTAILAYPDYLVYASPLARPQPTWYYLSDSNVEWGDDIGALADYLHQHGETAVTGAVVGGADYLQLHGITFHDASAPGAGGEMSTRYVAIGASYLNGSLVPPEAGQLRPDLFAAYRARTPVAVFGHSIFLYLNEPPPPGPTAPLPAAAFRAHLSPRDHPDTLRPGQTFLLGVTVRNDSPIEWLPAADQRDVRFQIRLGNRWYTRQDNQLVADDARAPVPYTIPPGGTVSMHLVITAPAQPGDYWLDIDLVQEGVTWFSERGSAPARIAVRVAP